MNIPTATTKGVKISVETFYHPSQSRPQHEKFVFAYRITIENRNKHAVQVLNRHWHIVDSTGQKREVAGEGIVGEQPILGPGQVHQYFSGTYFNSEIGKMFGSYQMQSLTDATAFDVSIPTFVMIAPCKLT